MCSRINNTIISASNSFFCFANLQVISQKDCRFIFEDITYPTSIAVMLYLFWFSGDLVIKLPTILSY